MPEPAGHWVRRIGLACLSIAALAGCELKAPPDSDIVATRDMTIRLTAADEGGGADATIRLTGPFGPVRLTGGDTLRLTAAGAAQPLQEVDDEDGFAYVAALGAVSGDVVLDLERPADHSAHGLSALIPPPFSLAAEDAAGSLSLTWDPGPGGYDLVLRITGSCIRPFSRAFGQDTGAYIVQAAELAPADPGAPAGCMLTIALARSVMVQAPLLPGLEGGYFYASTGQSREIQVEWLP